MLDVTADAPTLDLRAADTQTVDRVADLLRRNDLPASDVTAHPERFVLAFADDSLVGVGGLESAGSVGLLRSLVVRDGYRGNGYGGALCDALESRARDRGVETLYLLTTTASGFFESRGYEVVDRDTAPDGIQQTAQFDELCPQSATCMRRDR